MACCGQKRDAVRTQARAPVRAAQRVMPGAPVRTAPAAALALSEVDGASDRGLAVMLQYRNRSPITVRGARTGKRYEFLCGGAMQTVDAQDAEALIATGMFDRIRN
jgi:hypothetical protein